MLRRNLVKPTHFTAFFHTKPSFNLLNKYIPDSKKVKELEIIQEKETKELLDRHNDLTVRELNHIGYAVSRQSPKSVVETGGLLSDYAPSHYLGSFILSLSPQVACSLLPQPGGLHEIYLYAAPLQGKFIVTKKMEFVVTPVLPLKGWWLTRHIQRIRDGIIELGPIEGFYDRNCLAVGKDFDEYVNNKLQMPPIEPESGNRFNSYSR